MSRHSIAALYWYLLAADGRVQRGYRAPQAPNGDVNQFDFDSARREAPADGGSYTVEGTRLTFVMGMETIAAELTPDGHLVINGSLYRNARVSQP